MKYFITGRVLPERDTINISPVEFSLDGGGTALVSCNVSQITIVLDVPHLNEWLSAYKKAIDLAIIFIGALGFTHGAGFSTELVQVIEDNGTAHVVGHVRPAFILDQNNPDPQTLGFNVNDPAFFPLYNRAAHLSSRDIPFRLALQDYLQAVTSSTMTGLYCATSCYRAIESIKSSCGSKAGLEPTDKKYDEKAWDTMHKALGTNKEDIESKIKDFADQTRHGNWSKAKVPDTLQSWEMLYLTQDILLKYLDYSEPAT